MKELTKGIGNKRGRKPHKEENSELLARISSLRSSHTKLLAKELGREPTDAEVEERIHGVMHKLFATISSKEKTK